MGKEKSTKEMIKDFDINNAKITALEDGSLMMDGVNIGLRDGKDKAEKFIASLSDNVVKIMATFIGKGEDIEIHYTNSDGKLVEFTIDKCIYENGLLLTKKYNPVYLDGELVSIAPEDERYSSLDFALTLDMLGETPESAIG